MATTFRALSALLFVSCSQEFTSASNHNISNSDSGNPVRMSDSGSNTIPSDTALDIRDKDSDKTEPDVITTFDAPVQVHIDSMANAPEGSTNDATEPHPEDAGREASLPPEAADSAPSYCINCQPVFGRPPCCSIYLKCGYITTLGNCTSGAFQ